MSKLKFDIKNKNILIIVYTIKSDVNKKSWIYYINSINDTIKEFYYLNNNLIDTNNYNINDDVINKTIKDLLLDDYVYKRCSNNYYVMALLDK